MRKVLVALVIAVTLSVGLTTGASATAVATSMDFDVGSFAGTISYAGGLAPVSGSGISVLSVTADNGASLAITDGLLTFTSGPSSGGWVFGPGGSIAVSGKILGWSTSQTLLAGTFDSAQVISTGPRFRLVFGSFFDTKHLDLTNYFGMPSGSYEGNLSIMFTTLTNMAVGQPFTSAMVTGGDVYNAPVPIPGALWLFAPALAGLVGFRRRLGR
jgi:hypothetical protein